MELVDVGGPRHDLAPRPIQAVWLDAGCIASPNPTAQRVTFTNDKQTSGRVLVSVKGGTHIGPQFVRDLLGAVETQKAQMGILVTLEKPTGG
jgi:hypothetical protein